MLKKGLEITDRTVVALISACFQMGNLALGSRTHAYVYKTVTHHEDCVFIGTGLMDMYSKCRCLASALKVFDNMRDRNVLTWSKHHGSRVPDPRRWQGGVEAAGRDGEGSQPYGPMQLPSQDCSLRVATVGWPRRVSTCSTP
ncbi:hypothetical protein GW17_00060877 [Ensete ventricosum]|nr:hypothetical protein GW17_00060877 [Ensete ventricosum]